MRVVNRHEVLRLARTGAQLVEVLGQEEFDWAHLPDARQLDLRAIEDDADTLDRGQPVVVYCNDFL